MYRVEMHVYSPIFQGQLIEKNGPITFIVWKKKFYNKYQDVTHVSTSIFQGLFKNIVFRSVA